MNTNRHQGFLSLFVLWPLTSAIAWAFGNPILRLPVVHDLQEVPKTLITVFVHAAITGGLLGIASTVFFRPLVLNRLRWVLTTSIALPSGIVGGLLLNIAYLNHQATYMGMSLTDGNSNSFLTPSPILTLTFAGILLGIAQYKLFRSSLQHSYRRMALWTLGVASSLGFSWYIASIFSTPTLFGKFTMGLIMGLLSGALIGLILIALSKDAKVATEGKL